MISAVPFQNALLMGGYGLGKKWTEKSDHDGCDTNAGEASRPLIPIFVGGCTGGIAQSFLMSPVEYIKVQQQVVHPESASPTATLRQIMATAGPSSGARTPRTSGLSSQSSLSWTTRGLNATLLRDGIPHGVWFVAYEWCKGTMERTASKHVHVDVDLDRSTTTMNNSTTPSSTYQQLIVPITSGAFAATVAWVRILHRRNGDDKWIY
jgi:solute carrier family 25 carnitine/acylcarnitine transporter 20/29